MIDRIVSRLYITDWHGAVNCQAKKEIGIGAHLNVAREIHVPTATA